MPRRLDPSRRFFHPTCRCLQPTHGSSSDERDEFEGRARGVKTPKSTRSHKGNGNLTHRDVLPFQPSEYTRFDKYKHFRDEDVDIDELKNWNQTTYQIAIEGTWREVWANLETAIRRGVPDCLKRTILQHALGSGEAIRGREGWLTELYESVFGKVEPSFQETHLPTFSGGFLGPEKELHGASEEPRYTLDFVDASDVKHKRHSITSRQHLSTERRLSFTENSAGILATTVTMSQRNSLLRSGSGTNLGMPRNESHGTMKTTVGPFLMDVERKLSYGAYAEKAARVPYTMHQTSSRLRASGSRAGLMISLPSLGNVNSLTIDKATNYASLLSAEGQKVVTRILWTINSRYPQIEFAPLLLPLTCVLLVYLDEEHAVSLLLKILDKSKDLLAVNASRVFLTFRRSEFVRLVKQAQAITRKHLTELVDHLNELGVDLAAWLARAMQDGFGRLLPFDLLLRMYIPFVFEGSKIFLRYALALLVMEEEALLACTTADDANRLLLFAEYRGASPDTLNDLTKLAFRLRIRSTNDPMSKYSSHDLPTPYLTATRVPQFYRPRLDQSSDIIGDRMWMDVWRWIPHHCRILDPYLPFASYRDGHSLRAMQRVIWDVLDVPMLFFVKTAQGEILGGFAPFAFRADAKSVAARSDLSSSFVCQLSPNSLHFKWSGRCTTLMDLTSCQIIFGSEAPALTIDEELQRGHSSPSKAFESPRLVADSYGDFEIVSMEVWLLE